MAGPADLGAPAAERACWGQTLVCSAEDVSVSFPALVAPDESLLLQLLLLRLLLWLCELDGSL